MKIDAVVSLFLQCAPGERAEILSIIRGKIVESRVGALTKENLEEICSSTRTLDEVAVKIGVSRRTLQYHMRLLGLPLRRNRVLAPTGG